MLRCLSRTELSCDSAFEQWGRRYDPYNLITREERSHCPRQRRQQLPVSSSMGGRILTGLKRRGRLVEPLRAGVSGSRRALRPRPYAVRKPKQYAVSEPGDLVEVDTPEQAASRGR